MDLINSFRKHLDKIISIQTGMTSKRYIKEIEIGLNEIEENSKIFIDKKYSITSEIIYNTQINPLFIEFKDYQFGLNTLIEEFEYQLKKTKDENVFHNISTYKSILYQNLGVVNEVIKYLEANSPNPLTETIEQRYKNIFDNLKPNSTLPPEPIVKQKPEPNGKLITFKNSEIIEKIHSELKGYFPNKEAELLKVLQGEQLSELLLFPHNQNKFVEVFRRLKYNGFLLNTDTETKNWICTTFQFVKKRFVEPQPFNGSSVWDNLNKGKGEPAKKERICVTEWLPYKSPLQLTRETKNEKL